MCPCYNQNIYIHTYIHTYIYTHIHTYIHTYTHTYICTHTHTHTHTVSVTNTHFFMDPTAETLLMFGPLQLYLSISKILVTALYNSIFDLYNYKFDILLL